MRAACRQDQRGECLAVGRARPLMWHRSGLVGEAKPSWRRKVCIRSRREVGVGAGWQARAGAERDRLPQFPAVTGEESRRGSRVT